ncbi:HD-like signal output (HDOD) domain, no enzymatic activity [Frankineae bacterium MT45]|nr:HD-like signal output (HDOD) domain, no enzymatic activity [Frankineae bacterium MT45]
MITAVDVLARFEDLPSRAGAATRVLVLADDADTTATDLAHAIGTDPAFAALVISLANSAYYGLGGRVTTLHYAVSVIGFQTIRSLAVTLAAGLDNPKSVPAGFWEQAATAAAASNLLAPMLGASAGDAFSLGLVHTLGSALLHQHSPLPALCLPFPDDAYELDVKERELYGIGHAAAGAQVLAGWRFPERLCTLIAGHHSPPLPNAAPLERVLHASRALSDLVLSADPNRERIEHSLVWMSEGRIAPSDVDALARDLERDAESLLALLPT